MRSGNSFGFSTISRSTSHPMMWYDVRGSPRAPVMAICGPLLFSGSRDAGQSSNVIVAA